MRATALKSFQMPLMAVKLRNIGCKNAVLKLRRSHPRRAMNLVLYGIF
jgi:hypothetical protein